MGLCFFSGSKWSGLHKESPGFDPQLHKTDMGAYDTCHFYSDNFIWQLPTKLPRIHTWIYELLSTSLYIYTILDLMSSFKANCGCTLVTMINMDINYCFFQIFPCRNNSWKWTFWIKNMCLLSSWTYYSSCRQRFMLDWRLLTSS